MKDGRYQRIVARDFPKEIALSSLCPTFSTNGEEFSAVGVEIN